MRTITRRRLSRAAAGFLIGGLVLLPVSAHAAPIAPGGETSTAASWKDDKDDKAAEKAAEEAEKAAEKAAKDAEKAADKAAEEAAKANRDAEKAAEKAAEEAEKAAKKAAEDAAKADKEADKAAEKAAEEAAKADKAAEKAAGAGAATGELSSTARGPGGEADEDAQIVLPGEALGNDSSENAGVVAVVSVATPLPGRSTVPSAVPAPASTALPSQGMQSGGFASIDIERLPAHLGLAVMLFDQDAGSSVQPSVPVTSGVSGSVIRTLAPALPPALTNMVTSPLVLLDALLDAMASSGQALVIPFVAGLFGFLSPGLRRKFSIEAALGGDDDRPSE